ncbi:MAG: hypothetical protein ACO25B_09070 [Chitinophagaceae bacterium]
MKNLLILISFTALVSSCGSNSAGEPEVVEEDTVALSYSWKAGLNDSTGELEVKKTELGSPDSLTATSMITFLNTKTPNIQLQFVKISGDTIYVSIPDALYLTQQMGSTGPSLYFAETVYNLTEIPGIRFVNFNFEEGDHAAPGVLHRGQFGETKTSSL